MQHFKDEILDRLAKRGNVAQFVAFRPSSGAPVQSFARLADRDPNQQFLDAREALESLFASSNNKQINIRSYLPDDPRSREFVYGIASAEEAFGHLNRLTDEGLYTIANETIDIHDGGVSGVIQGDTIEFSPDDTPRCVEKPGVAAFAFREGLDILETVYGFRPDLQCAQGERTEFSIHPQRRGWRQTHTLIWEHESGVPTVGRLSIRWPNRFSRLIGDKAYGLLIADRLNFPVPETLVIPRRLAPFRFGRSTSSNEVWIRTSPYEPQPGLFTTHKGWIDPFKLLWNEDPAGDVLASVLCQAAVPATYSGAAIVGADGELIVEGRHGEGDRLMLGLERPERLPSSVEDEVRTLHRRISSILGPVRIEWAHDAARVWLLQCHVGATQTSGSVLVPGEPATWTEFPVSDGLEALRDLLESLPAETGVLLLGEIGSTSHIADLVRRAGAPARVSAC